MRRIDQLHLDYPFAGGRMLRGMLKAEGREGGAALHVSTADEADGRGDLPPAEHLQAGPGQKIFPYLLRNLAVWSRGPTSGRCRMTYVPMARGFVYLAAVVDWFSRKVLALADSITCRRFCVEAQEALARHGRPKSSTRSGSQFTVPTSQVCCSPKIEISMDGKGAWRDKVAGSPTVKRHSCLRRAALADGEIRGGLPLRLYGVAEARARIGRSSAYNARSPHSKP